MNLAQVTLAAPGWPKFPNLSLVLSGADEWLSHGCSQEKLMQRVGAGLVAIQESTRMHPPDPEAAGPAVHAALGSEAAALDLLAMLDCMQAQVWDREQRFCP